MAAGLYFALTLCCVLGGRISTFEQVGDYELALHHAPVIYQDLDPDNPLPDLMVAWDFDGNAVSSDNWENLERGSLAAAAYYSIVETDSHWYILYGIYHARDTSTFRFLPDLVHENDFEGLMLLVEKDGTEMGRVAAAFTMFHRDFNPYVAAHSQLGERTGDNISRLRFEDYGGRERVMATVEAGGHGVSVLSLDNDVPDFDENTIRYVPGERADMPFGPRNDPVSYQLRSLTPLWSEQLRHLAGGQSDSPSIDPADNVFDGWGRMDGDRGGDCPRGINLFCTTDSARMPWAWDDADDDLPPGLMALDPVSVVDLHFEDLGEFDRIYTRNIYIASLRQMNYRTRNHPPSLPASVDLDALYLKVDF